MAPVPDLHIPISRHVRHLARSTPALPLRSLISTTIHSIVAWSGRQAISIASQAANDNPHTSSQPSRKKVPPRSSSRSFEIRQISQNAIVAIPTTYKGLNSGPAPAAVVGIVLGSVLGFLLFLALLYSVLRLSGLYSTTVVEEEVIRRRTRSASHSRRRSPSQSETTEIRSEVRSPPRRRESRREETIIVEERISRAPEPPPEDDIVEVIEDHSPERRPRRESKRMSGYRTVDPAEFAGGDRPMRKVSRRGG